MATQIINQRSADATSSLVTVDTLATVLQADVNRNGFRLQNIGTVAVYVKYGSGCSATDFSFVLKAGTGAKDGNGGQAHEDVYCGVVTALAASGTGNQLAVVTY